MTGPELVQAIRQFTINLLKENQVTVNYSETANRETETFEWNINVSTNFHYVVNLDGLCQEEEKTQLSIPQKFDEIMRLFNIVCTTGDMDTMNRYAHDVRVALKALDGKENIENRLDGILRRYNTKSFVELERKLQALEIIKSKRVDMTSLKESIALDKEVNYYNSDRRFGKQLIKKEYNLLKEVLK